MSAAKKSLPWERVWITGASTGIGREVAVRLAEAGAIVACSARSADKLADMSAISPNLRPYALDVTDLIAAKATHARIEANIGPLDLVILNAGVWHPMGAEDYDPERVFQSMDVNYKGVVAALAPVMAAMRARRRGHIAIVASVAGYRGLPKSSAYGPTKAALINLVESLAAELSLNGVTMSIVNPGFVRTPMTAVNDFPMPFIIDSDEAANRIIAGLQAKRYEIAFPTRMAIAMKLMQRMPNWLFLRISRRMVPKPEK